MKKILIFGCTGFFGTHFLNSLDPKKYDLSVVTRKKYTPKNLKSLTYNQIFNGEIFSKHKKFDEVFDFSSNVSVDDFINTPQDMFLENIRIPILNLEVLNKLNFEGRFNFISTDRATHEISDNMMEEIVLDNDPYGASKLISEIIVKYNFNLKNIETSVIRFPNLYGSNQSSKQFIPTIINQIKENNNKEILIGSSEGSRNYLHVNDAVEALNLCLESKIKFKNICFSGKNESLSNIIEIISDLYKKNYGKNLKFKVKKNTFARNSYKMPPMELEDKLYRQTYNWKPKTNLKMGLEDLLKNIGTKNE